MVSAVYSFSTIVEVDEIFEYDWIARVSLRAVGSTEPEARAMPVPARTFGVSPKRTSDDPILISDLDLCRVSSPATLLFNLPFYRANDALIMIGDLLCSVAGEIVDGDWKILSRGDGLQKWSAQ